MAGIEKLEIHSRSYLVRWVNVTAAHTISWTIQPQKKSINFGIFRRPEGAPSTHNLPSSSTHTAPTPVPHAKNHNARKAGSSRNDASTATEQLESEGLVPVKWLGKCEADKVYIGEYDVLAGQGGMYALVFDNTFSKQVSKTVTIVILTYPSNAPPKASHHQHHLQSHVRKERQPDGSHQARRPATGAADAALVSTDSLPAASDDKSRPTSDTSRSPSAARHSSRHEHSPNFYTGILRKRRRKRHQGYGRRFFSLDYTSCTLSYYHDRRSFALRGSIPLSLAAIGANGKTREISIDSGAEVWHLRAGSQREFEGWKNALEKASASAHHRTSSTHALALQTSAISPTVNPVEEDEWDTVEALVNRVAGTRDAMRRLMLETDSRRISPPADSAKHLSPNSSPTETGATSYFEESEKRPFWKRKPSSGASTPGIFRRTVSGQLAVPTQAVLLPTAGPGAQAKNDESLGAHHAALLHDLDAVVEDFSNLISASRRRRVPLSVSATSRLSLDSASPTEFFDADDGDERESRILVIRDDGDSSASGSEYATDEDDRDSMTSSDAGSPERAGPLAGYDLFFPPRPSSLSPLPLEPVRRRGTLPPAKVQPPSLIGFLRKNVGKDLSTISMPVSANEPTSLLQRAAEQLEYSSLLDAAAKAETASVERLLFVTAFAVSVFSNNRVKERVIRKPFNPMLGETFECIREERGYRFIAEKVTHRPVRMACHAESKEWTFTQSPMPIQKFWGKSAELNTDGPARVLLHSGASKECFAWTPATCFLRNIIAGEKYIEPVSTMTVLNETTGHKAIVTFKAKGMFSGRSEDVVVHTADGHGSDLSLGLAGKWTTSLSLTQDGTILHANAAPMWTVGPLVDNPATHYGMTAFAASLNEITAVERDNLPPTDTRLRPDQRVAEEGNLELAETTKAKLEDEQRIRRKQLEQEGKEWVPRWFEKVAVGGEDAGGREEVWRLRRGEDGYWERRANGDWTGVTDVFGV